MADTDRYSKGVPFNDTTNWRLDIVERGQQILGDRLLGFQAGNEPDLYVSHGRRKAVSEFISPTDESFKLRLPAGLWSSIVQGRNSKPH